MNQQGQLVPRPDVAVNLALACAFAGALAVALLLRATFTGEDAANILSKLRLVLEGQVWNDSWGPLHKALAAWRSHDPAGIYGATFQQGVKFQYPPISLVVPMVVSAFGGGEFSRAYVAADVVSVAFIAFATRGIVVETFTRAGLMRSSRLGGLLTFVLTLVLTITFYPILRAVELGQIQVWIDALFAVSLLSWIRGGRVVPGILIALICLVKPQLALFFFWALLRREWRFATALAVVGGLGLTISVLVFGIPNHIGYLQALSVISQHGESFYANQSVNGVLNRIVGLGDPAHYPISVWDGAIFPPYNALVYAGTLLSSLALVAWALFGVRRGDGRVLDFCTMAMVCTIASPVAWEHHYGVAFPIFAVLLQRFWRRPALLAGLAVSYLLMGEYFPALQHFAETPLNVLLSNDLASGLALLVLLHLAGREGVVQPDSARDGRGQAAAGPLSA